MDRGIVNFDSYEDLVIETGPGLAFPTIDHFRLNYDWIYEKNDDYGNRPVRFAKTERFTNALNSKNKTSLPRINAFTGTRKGFFLDFDDLGHFLKNPNCKGLKTWDDVFSMVRSKYKNYGFTFRSASGKVKVFLPVQSEYMDFELAEMIVDSLDTFDDRGYYKYCDHSASAYQFSFINSVEYDRLYEWLTSEQHLKCLDNMDTVLTNIDAQLIMTDIDRDFNTEIEDEVEVDSFKWNSFKGQLPVIPGMKMNKTKEYIIRYLAGYFNSANNDKIGIGLSQAHIQEVIGSTRKTIYNNLTELIEAGLLIKTFQGSLSAQQYSRYAFSGQLLTWAICEAQKLSENGPSISAKARRIVEGLSDGDWNQGLLELTRCFPFPEQEEDYFQVLEERSDLTEERKSKAESIWKSHIKNSRLK